MKLLGADEVARALADEGVLFTFGIPGTHNIELYDALERGGRVEPVLVTDEQSASFMADAVSRSTGTVGVANVVPGAGVTHCLSGVAEAFMDGVPMVVLTCGIRGDSGKAYQLHDIDQLAVLRPVVKGAFRVERHADLYAMTREAFALARGGCPGPVAIEVPANLYMLAGPSGEPARQPAPQPPVPVPDQAALDESARLLLAARAPAIYAGVGCRGATAQLRLLAERLAAPVATTFQGKGVFPETHPLWLWNGFGRSAPAFVQRVMERCDCLLAIGCRFGEVATGSYGLEPPADLIHVDIDGTVLGRNFPARLGVRADAGAFLSGLLSRLVESRADADLAGEVAAGHREVAAERRPAGGGERVGPAALFAALQDLAGPDTIYATDSGNGTFLAMEHLRLAEPGRFLAPVDYSCMGYSVPAAIAAKLAHPTRDVVALAGDGALLMTGLELLTAVQLGAAPLVVVLRDSELGQIAQFQRTSLVTASTTAIAPYEVRDFAAAVRCRYARAATEAELPGALAEALAMTRAGQPVLFEVDIDYSQRTYFTNGVLATNFWRLPWPDRLRVAGRSIARRLARR